MRMILILNCVITFTATRLCAQTPTASWPSWATEASSGAGLAVAMRGPWINPTWRRHFVIRMGMAAAVSASYERFVDWNGWSWKDVSERMAGTVVTDLVWSAVAHRLRRRP